MKKIIGVTILAVFLAACSSLFEEEKVITGISIFNDNQESYSITIQRGETITLTAQTSGNTANAFIIWELNNQNAAITSSSMGQSCSIRGMESGETILTVKARRNTNDEPALRRAAITVIEPQITEIILKEPLVIGVNEERDLAAEIFPAWARGINVTWSGGAGFAQISGGKIKGISEGNAEITAAAPGFTKNFSIEVKTPAPLDNLSVFNGSAEIVHLSEIEIDLFEELQLRAEISPASAYTWFNWTSDNPEYAAVTNTGILKGLKPTIDNPVTINLTASGREWRITVRVKNPVTGIRVMFDNSERLPVNNVIWLSPEETVNLAVELAPAGITGNVTWSGANGEVSYEPSGLNCTITGGSITRFDALPTELRITAENADNERPVMTAILVKTQPPPVWAWDRGRDISSLPAVIPLQNNPALRITGRGDFTEMPIGVSGNPIPYNASGLLVNSSNNLSGLNPGGAAPTPGNSTRIMIGTTNRTATTADDSKRAGVFDFYNEGGTIRVSVDYEIVWTAGAGRNMWLLVNNNNANAMQSELGTSSQLLINPLTDPRGTRRTVFASLNVDDFISRNIPGVNTLNEAFIAIVCLSNGGSVYVSGIRIEREF